MITRTQPRLDAKEVHDLDRVHVSVHVDVEARGGHDDVLREVVCVVQNVVPVEPIMVDKRLFTFFTAHLLLHVI